MFIIPASVVAKIMMAVTISLHPAAHHAPASYTVHQGDTLSAIAARSYGNSADWPAVWWMNRHQVRNPNVLARRATAATAGQRPCDGRDSPRRPGRHPGPARRLRLRPLR